MRTIISYGFSGDVDAIHDCGHYAAGPAGFNLPIPWRLYQLLQERNFLAQNLCLLGGWILAQRFVLHAQVAPIVRLAQDLDDAREINVALVDRAIVFAVFPAHIAPDVLLVLRVADALAVRVDNPGCELLPDGIQVVDGVAPPVEVRAVQRQAQLGRADAGEELLQELRVVGDLAVVLDAVADTRAGRDLAKTLAGVNGEGQECLPAELARHHINANDIDAQRLGSGHQLAGPFQLLVQLLVQVVRHHERADAAAARRQVVFQGPDAVIGGQGIAAVRVEEVGAVQIQIDLHLRALRTQGLHAGPAIGFSGGFEMDVAAADGPFALRRREQRGFQAQRPGREGQAGGPDDSSQKLFLVD